MRTPCLKSEPGLGSYEIANPVSFPMHFQDIRNVLFDSLCSISRS